MSPFVWLVSAVSQLILRRRMNAAAKDLTLKMWLFPHLTWLSIAVITALLVGMVIVEQPREALLLSTAPAAIVVALGVYRYRRGGSGPSAELAKSSGTLFSPVPKEWRGSLFPPVDKMDTLGQEPVRKAAGQHARSVQRDQCKGA